MTRDVAVVLAVAGCGAYVLLLFLTSITNYLAAGMP